MEYKDLIDELNSCPNGYISTKRISGKDYYYLQHTENGRKVSEYVREYDISKVRDGIEKRKGIEKVLKEMEASQRNLPKPSISARNLTGYLMMKNEIVAEFKDGVPIYIDVNKAPLLIARTGNLQQFLRERSIDRDRTHSRLLKKILDIHEDEDYIVSLYSYGACITDNYWFKPLHSKLKYEDISFSDDEYWRLALKGDTGYIPRSPKYSPQLTLNGSYEKCWKLINGQWWLYKQGNNKEIFSELFCSNFAQLIKVKTAAYEYADGYIRTLNFADTMNFEPVSSVAGSDDSFDNVFSALLSIDEGIAEEYIRLICFDVVVNNVDRHNENCGIMRSKSSGSILGLAPNYDNNMALLSVTSNLNFDSKRDGHFQYFMRFIDKNETAKMFFTKMKFKTIKDSDIRKCIPNINVDADEDAVVSYISDRYNYLKYLQNSFLSKK